MNGSYLQSVVLIIVALSGGIACQKKTPASMSEPSEPVAKVRKYDIQNVPEHNFVLDDRDNQWRVIPKDVEPFEFLKGPDDDDIFTADLVSFRSDGNRLIARVDLHTDGDADHHSQMVFDTKGRLVSFETYFNIYTDCQTSVTKRVPDYPSNTSELVYSFNGEEAVGLHNLPKALLAECEAGLEGLEYFLETADPLWTSISQFPDLIRPSFER